MARIKGHWFALIPPVRNLAHASMGNTRRAAAWFRRAVELMPSEPFLLNQASWLLATAPDDVRDGRTDGAVAG